jgi:predicted acetyltransferase
MSIEIRPVAESEAVDYLRVLPQATGLPTWEPSPAAWFAGHGPWPPPAPPSEERLAAYAQTVVGDGFHSQAAFVDGRIVGGSATVSLELTVPGMRQVAFGGVTATGVLPTHRRRGLLRKMMTAMLEGCRDRGEFLAGLSASEGGIYGRYGFSPATFQVRWELERSEAAFADDSGPDGGLELVKADVVKAAWPDLHDRIRRSCVGEISARPGKWNGLADSGGGTDGPLRFLIHRDADGTIDGIAHFRTPWSADPALVGTLQVEVLEAATPTAYAAMWRLLADFDLTRRVVAAKRPVDEPLRWMLANPRAMRTTRSSDNLWLRILDVSAALQARRYEFTGSLVIAVEDPMFPSNEGPWLLDADPDGASCRREPRKEADLAVSVQALSSLYLGGVSAATLAQAGQIKEARPGSLALVHRLFHQDPPPFNAVGF